MAKTPANSALTAGLACYLIWGFVPLAIQVIGGFGVGSWEILAHRILWSAPTALIFVLLAHQWRQVVAVFRQPRVLAWLALSSALVTANWIVFIWAVNSGRVLETSLGYYINPLVNMACGALLFRERIDRIGKAAIALAVVGVTVQAFALGHLPLVSLALALSFGGYGVVRKQVAADAQTGLFIECLILGLPSLAFILWLEQQGGGHFFGDPAATAWLLASGPITAVPLVLFSWAARRLPLSAIGFLQFIAPTISFFIGVAQGEAFTPLRALSFVFIWGGAAVFAYGAWRRTRALSPAN
ncbi:EamA family transporter RarD [Phenylobacterium sp.]|uniref:EamA family transporter RarD n=1 Tax=Phenylobacterium sp. TaxID=1871053 RepID=UPI00273752C2|nr:EamA family transporter RarD [Phenylobacterium sp.]MDP3852999.1 EamA family transporter RarD [Phenylobacterium sp.]